MSTGSYQSRYTALLSVTLLNQDNTDLVFFHWFMRVSSMTFVLILSMICLLTLPISLLKRAKPYNCASNRYNLFLWEKYFFIFKPKITILNKRNELVSACIALFKLMH
jgi:hypothetical protein